MVEPIRRRIIETAHRLFINRGYRNVTMQNIAAELGMSKKTLYLYFASKDEIAQAVIEATLQSISNHVNAASSAEANPLAALQETLLRVKEETLQLSPLFLGDIQKSVPHLWDYIVRIRSEKVKFVIEMLHKAKQMGQIRSSLNPEMVTVLLMETIQSVIRPDVWSKHGFALDELWDTVFTVFFYGISNHEASV